MGVKESMLKVFLDYSTLNLEKRMQKMQVKTVFCGECGVFVSTYLVL